MSKYISIDDFRQIVGTIIGNIREEINNGFVFVTISIIKDGKPVNWGDTRVTGLTLTQTAPKIYQLEKDDSGLVTVRVTFNVSEVHNVEKDFLNSIEETLTFNTYKEYLEFFTKKFGCLYPEHLEKLNVHGVFKHTDIAVPSYLSRKVCPETGRISLSPLDFINLNNYHFLPDDIKNAVDAELFPVTVHRDDVQLNSVDREVTVYIDKQDVLDRGFGTHRYDDIVKNVIGKMTV